MMYFAPILNISVVDNGRGFDDTNARGFFLSDSTSKATRGNKGIGRFTWLKVFDKAVIDSIFKTVKLGLGVHSTS